MREFTIINNSLETHYLESLKTILNDGLLVVGMDRKVLEGNRNAERILGYESGELKGMHLYSFFRETGDESSAIPEEVNPLISLFGDRKSVSNIPLWMTLKNGEKALVRSSATQVIDNKREIAYVIILFQDLTDISRQQDKLLKYGRNLELANEELRGFQKASLSLIQDANIERDRAERALLRLKKSQKELIESERQFRDMFEYVPIAYQSLDKNGCFIDANDEMLKLLGYTWEELKGQEFGSVWSERTREMFPIKFCDFQASGETHGELTLKHKSGRLIPAIVNGRIQYDSDGQFVRTHCIFYDISERKRVEAKLAEAKRKAEEANMLKSEFLANMSHEIRTPLNAVTGLTHLALLKNPDSEIKDYLNKISRSSKSLLGVINDILDFSKIEAGKIKVENICFHLEEVFSVLIDMFGQKIEEKNLVLQISCDEVPETLVGDALRVRQIFTNLISNAIKFTDSGSISIHGKVLSEMHDQYLLQFIVRDTGIGMEEDQLQKVFNAFEQADASTTRRFGGTGLGLSISKRLVMLMGGNITICSEPGVGTDFEFKVKLGKAPVDVGGAHIETLGEKEQMIRGRALVINSGGSGFNRVRECLELLNLVPVRATSISNARELVHNNVKEPPFQYVFVESQSTDESLSEFVHCLKAESRVIDSQEPKIIIICDGWSSGLRKIIESDFVDTSLQKPFSYLSFNHCIQSLGQRENPEGTVKQVRVVPTGRYQKLNGLRVLLVEDNELNQEVAVGLLEDVGCTVEVADNGLKSVELVGSGDYDIILMDIHMPVMDGFSATEKIRSLGCGSQRQGTGVDRKNACHLPIIAMTAEAQPEDKKRARKSGMDDHISKPIDPSELYKLMVKWTSARSGLAGEHNFKEELPDTIHRETPIEKDLKVLAAAGLRVDNALHFHRGNKSKFLKSLRKFKLHNLDKGAEIHQLLIKEDWEEAQRESHTIKGLAGLIGASELQEKSALLEEAIRERSSPETLDRCLELFSMELREINNVLQRFFQG